MFVLTQKCFTDQLKAIDGGLLSQLSFYEQYSAAAYCQSNNVAAVGTAIACNGNCNDVQSTGATSIIEFQKYVAHYQSLMQYVVMLYGFCLLYHPPNVLIIESRVHH